VCERKDEKIVEKERRRGQKSYRKRQAKINGPETETFVCSKNVLGFLPAQIKVQT
jgi:hypothetical protein